MAGHSILYLGRGEFAADYLSELETLPLCALLTRSAELEVPADAPSIIDVVPHRVQTTLHLIEVSSPPHAGHGFGLASFTGRA